MPLEKIVKERRVSSWRRKESRGDEKAAAAVKINDEYAFWVYMLNFKEVSVELARSPGEQKGNL